MAASTNGINPILTPDYPGLDIHANQEARILAVSVVLIVVSTLSVILRFVARALSKAGLWWDDWCILAALVMSWGCCTCMVVSIHYGFGRHVADQGGLLDRIAAATNWFKIFYIYEMLYTVAVVLTKYSILLFYSRIFKDFGFKLALWITTGFVTAWFIAIETSVIVECIPIHSLWDFSAGRCIDLTKFFVGAGVPNVVLNTVILILPLPMIWTLQIENKYKLALSSVFMLGGFIVVVSIVRVVILARTEQVDLTWTFVDPAIWTSVEPCIGVCSACLPILRSLWVRHREKRETHRTDQQSVGSVSSKKPPRVPEKDNHARVASYTSNTPLNELSTEGELPWGNHVSIYSHHRRTSSTGDDIPMEEISIDRADFPMPVSKFAKAWHPPRKSKDLTELA